MADILEMLTADHASVKSREQANRARFPAGAELKDLFAAHGMDGRITYAENAQGEKVGKRDGGPWIDGELIVRAAGWNARVYGKDEPQRDRVKRLRKEAT